jgi:hypothetical protein
MVVPELQRLKALEAENARLKRLVADQDLDNQMLADTTRRVCERLFGNEIDWLDPNYAVDFMEDEELRSVAFSD